jgi:hypothetical protein
MILTVFFAIVAAQEHADMRLPEVRLPKGRHLVSTLPFSGRAPMKIHALTRLNNKNQGKKPKNVRNCERSVS